MRLSNRHNKLSRFMSYALRHHPESIGLELDAEGWADVHHFIALYNAVRSPVIDYDMIKEVVFADDKARYAFDSSMSKVRASQGHSIQVELKLAASKPPHVLYHGTAFSNLSEIKQHGLRPMSRNHVHLSTNRTEALKVGSRHGMPCVLRIDCARMQQDFFVSVNGVWLTAYVAPEFITVEDTDA